MPPRLGDLLVKEHACAPEAIRDALKNQVIFGGRLGTNLLELEAVAEDALARALGRQHGIPALFGKLALDARATALLTAEIADRCEAVPYAIADRRLAVVVVDPRDLGKLDEVAFATGKQVHPLVAPEARVWALLRETYGIDRHLRGIDVDFGALRATRPGASAAAPARSAGPDLMDQGEFDALYGNRPTPPPGPRPPLPAPAAPALTPVPGEVIELTDLLEEPAAPGPSPLGFTEAVRALEGVTQRDAIAETVLRYAAARFARAVLLTVQRGAAHGWVGLGEALGRDAVRRIHLRLGTPGIVDTVARTQAHFLGPIPKTEANIRLLKAIGGGVPSNALVVPILAMGRVVNVLYADGGRGKLVDAGGVGELLILATRIAKSYDTLLERVH